MVKTEKTNYKAFSHTECEFFPCHEGIVEEDFNCIFCYCPLYSLGGECDGNYIYIKNNIKDCSSCDIPHLKKNYDFILSKLK